MSEAISNGLTFDFLFRKTERIKLRRLMLFTRFIPPKYSNAEFPVVVCNQWPRKKSFIDLIWRRILETIFPTNYSQTGEKFKRNLQNKVGAYFMVDFLTLNGRFQPLKTVNRNLRQIPINSLLKKSFNVLFLYVALKTHL